jgi:hypothetical protein
MKAFFSAIATRSLASCCLVLALASCAGVKCSVKAPRVDQPVSFTPCVFDTKGVVFHASEKDTLKHFVIRKHCWAMLWRLVNLTHNDLDLSDALSQEITGAGGDAIVNLTVHSQGDCLWFFTWPVPIIPSYHLILVEGDVVRLPREASGK